MCLQVVLDRIPGFFCRDTLIINVAKKSSLFIKKAGVYSQYIFLYVTEQNQ